MEIGSNMRINIEKDRSYCGMMDKNIYLNFLKSRRSVRKYLPKDPPLELIDCLVETALWAPSAHNAQPWRFFIIREKGIKQKLAREMARRYQQDLERDGVERGLAVARASGSVLMFSGAPVLVVACIDMSNMDSSLDEVRQRAEEIMATQSLAAGIQNLLLGATAVGLGGCWFCAPLFCQEIVKNIIGTPKHYMPQALITLGYPDEAPNPPSRLDVDEIRKVI